MSMVPSLARLLVSEDRPIARKGASIKPARSRAARRRRSRGPARPALDLDQHGQRTRPLRELRRALVERQHVGVAVTIERPDAAGVSGSYQAPVCNCATPGLDRIGHDRAGEAGATRVEHADHVAVGDLAIGRVARN